MVARIGFVRKADRLVLAAATALLLLSCAGVARLALAGNIPVEGIGVPVSQRISNFEKESAISNKNRQFRTSRQARASPRPVWPKGWRQSEYV